MQDKQDKKANSFIRLFVMALASFITWLVAYSFLSLEPKGTISAGIVTLTVLLVAIVLSESFDNFSVGKFLTMSKEIKVKDTSIDRLSTENTELRRELISVVTSVSQNQSSTNIIGLPDDLAKRMGVEKATEEEISNKRTEENEESTERTRPVRKKVNHQKLEELVFSHFLQKKNLTNYDLIQEAKLVTQFNGIDSVSNIHPIYDGYINTGESEIFIEIKVSRATSIMMRERIYLMLNKIYLYNKVKKANAHLNLLIVDIEGEENDSVRNQRNTNRIKEFFEPSIVNGLLRIVPIELSASEIEGLSDKI